MRYGKHFKFYQIKKNKLLIQVFIIIIIIMVISKTSARYITLNNNDAEVQIAKWNIMVNNELLSSNSSSLTNPIQLINVEDGTTKIDAGDECYFDIKINPSSTEVSIISTISVDLSLSSTTLPEGTLIEKYEKYTGLSEVLELTSNENKTSITITENLNLLNTETTLGNADIRKYRIFCKLPQYINAEKEQEYTIIPRIIISQNITNN